MLNDDFWLLFKQKIIDFISRVYSPFTFRFGSASVTEDDLSQAFSVSKDVHVNETLKNGERQLFELISEMTTEAATKGTSYGITSGQVQRRAKDELKIGYTYFFEYIKKLEELRLVDLVRRDGVHGKMSYVEMRGWKKIEYLIQGGALIGRDN